MWERSSSREEKVAAHLWVVVPAFNEATQIADTLAELSKYFPRVVVVDDGSSDGTFDTALATDAAVVRHSVNLGQGAALMTGIRYALRNGAQYVVTFDADGQHSAEDIPVLLDACRAGGADVAFGTRFHRDGIHVPIGRRLLLQAAVAYTRLTTGLSLSDTHNGLRLLTRTAASRLELRHNRMAHASELLTWAARSGLKLVEVPVRVRYSDYSTRKGQSSLSSFNIIWDLWSGGLHK